MSPINSCCRKGETFGPFGSPRGGENRCVLDVGMEDLGVFFGLDGVAFRVLLPLLWPASFFSCLKRMKNEIYIYILSDVFFGNCWCCLCLLMFHPIYKWVMFCFYACNYMVRDRNRLSLRMVQNEGDMEWHWRHYSGIIRMKHVSRFSIFRLREQCDENKCWDWTSNHLLAFSSTLLNLK